MKYCKRLIALDYFIILKALEKTYSKYKIQNRRIQFYETAKQKYSILFNPGERKISHVHFTS